MADQCQERDSRGNQCLNDAGHDDPHWSDHYRWSVIRAASVDLRTQRIERAAQAICGVWGYLWDGNPDDDQTAPERTEYPDDRPSRELFRKAARAALEADRG